MNLKKSRLFKRMLSLAMICSVTSQIWGIQGNAATEKTSWQLYFNPSSPSSEHVTTWKQALIAHSATSKFNITSIPSGAKVNLKVKNAKSGGNKNFSGTVSGYKVTVVKGYTYTYAVKYVDNVNYTNRVKGNIVH